jgi:hypothetical protein
MRRGLGVSICVLLLVGIVVVAGLLTKRGNEYGFWPDKQRDEFRDGF